jgi:hypothetical protein
MPELVELHHEWQDRGVRVQTVSLDLVSPRRIDTAEGVGAFAFEKEFFLPVVAFQGDPARLAQRYQLDGGIPLTLAINAEGEVVDRQLGGAKKARFEAMIRKALGD